MPRNELIFFFQAEDGIRDSSVTGVQTCALPIIQGRYVIFRPAGVQSVSFCMYVVSFVKRARVLKRSSTPRLPDLCRPHAQRTKRLQEALCRLGLKMGGQAGADTGQEQGLSGSRDTILRLVRRFPQPPASSPRLTRFDDS